MLQVIYVPEGFEVREGLKLTDDYKVTPAIAVYIVLVDQNQRILCAVKHCIISSSHTEASLCLIGSLC